MDVVIITLEEHREESTFLHVASSLELAEQYIQANLEEFEDYGDCWFMCRAVVVDSEEPGTDRRFFTYHLDGTRF